MLEQEELCKNAIKKGRLKVVKRPVLIAIIGYIIGIIMGLYFNFSIALFYIPIIVIYCGSISNPDTAYPFSVPISD